MTHPVVPEEPRDEGSRRVLDVRGLAYAYPDGHQALFGVDLHVRQGERVALLGPNGAGKTTLVLHLNGILQAGAGTVEISGLPVAKPHLKEIRRRVGIVFQDPDDKAEIEVQGDLYVVMRERDVHAMASERLADEATGLYL